MKVLAVTLHPAIDKVQQLSRLLPDEVNRTQVVMLYGGGKGNNSARALVRIGVPVIATGYQGGYSGAFITEALAGEGIQTEFVTCKAPTRTSVLIHEEATGYTYAIYEPGQAVEPEEIEALLEKFDSLLDQVAVCLLCGSGQTALLAPVYAKMIELARRKGVRCLLDSSGQALALGVEARPSVLKINQHELGEYLGRPLEDSAAQLEAIQEMCERGLAIVALSRGRDGILATNGSETWDAHLYMEKTINVVGCGDSVLAGMSKAMLENRSLDEIVRWGVACGAANTQVQGAGFIELDTVKALLPKVSLRKVSR
jgi:1-phosphofructokinase family hexose kinase